MYRARNPYTFETGGLTADVATLTNQEIIDYHRKYYDANNITVVMTGSFSDDFEEAVLQKLPAEMLKSSGSNSRTPIDCSPPPENGPRCKTVHFPSSDADVGAVWFGWRGPVPGDVETAFAVNILMEYLAENSSSPLNQRFVERSSPLANDISLYITDGVPQAIQLQFFGVPYPKAQDTEASCSDCEEKSDSMSENDSDNGSDEEDDKDLPHLFEEHYFEGLLIDEIRRLYDTGFDGDSEALLKATKRLRQRMAIYMEYQPEETIQSTLCADIVASHFSPASKGKFTIGTNARAFDTLDALTKKPV
ncbi:hypothetical protein LPJ75_007366, partial [Coemansia sp. RSA 2598]